MYTLTQDHSIVDVNSKFLLFSADRFIRDICQGNCCFICGVHPDDADFNNEHVVPDWMLRRFNLHDKTITLPNLRDIRYDRYKIPCCVDCNTFLGREYEVPVSDVISGGYESVAQHLTNEGPGLLFRWMALVYIKTHLKDRQLRFVPDLRIDEGHIADRYDWAELHHVHCIARSRYTGVQISGNALGSVIVGRAAEIDGFTSYDYSDIYSTQTAMQRTGDLFIIAIFNDSRAMLSIMRRHLERITAPLTPIQIRELFAQYSYGNSVIDRRPAYYTTYDDIHDSWCINAIVPSEITQKETNNEEYGEMMYSVTRNILSGLRNGDQDEEIIKTGRFSYLFNTDGSFNTNSMLLQAD